MEIIHIVGCRAYSFTDEKTGEVKTGCTFFFTQEDDRVDGVSAGKFSVSRDLMDRLTFVPSPGCDVEVFYNKFGKVSDIRKAK